MKLCLITQRGAYRGFSLVETIVVIALFTVLSLVVTNTIDSFYRFNAYTFAQSFQVSYARDGMEQLVRDLREMTFADDGTFPLAEMEDNQIAFYSDIDRDDSVEYVEYTLASTTLWKRIYDATGTPPVYDTTPEISVAVSEYVQNGLQSIPIFVYYDTLGNVTTPTSTITDVRYVEATLIINVDPVRDPGEFMLRSSASLRNLKGVQ